VGDDGADEQHREAQRGDRHHRPRPADQQRQYFSVYAASLIDSLAAYAASPGARPSADGLSYHRAVVHLSDEERARFADRFGELVGEMLAVPPAAHRRRYHIASSLIPEPRS